MNWENLAASDLPKLNAVGEIDSSFAWSRGIADATQNAFTVAPPAAATAGATTVAHPPAPPRRIESLEEAIYRREQEIVEKVVKRAVESSQSRIQKRIAARAQADWEEDLHNWIREMVAPSKQQVQDVLSPTRPFQETTALPPSAVSTESQDYIKAHCKIVEDHMENTSVSSVCSAFLRLTLTRPHQNEYSNAWKLVAKLEQSNPSSPESQCRAALSFYAEQYREYIVQQTNRSMLSLLEQCQYFQRQSHRQDVWSTIFLCLRCGDAVSASRAGCNVPEVQRILVSLANAQGSCSSLWESAAIPNLNPADVQEVRSSVALLERTGRLTLQQVGVMKLISLLPPFKSIDLDGMKTIEDFVYSSLFRALLTSSDLAFSLTAIAGEIEQESRNYALETIPWGSALPLMATQHYRKAMDNMMKRGPNALLQAVHVALVLKKRGIKICDVGSDDNYLGTLLEAYAGQLQDTKLAALYLKFLPNERSACKAIAKVLARGTVNEFFKSAGRLDNNGEPDGTGTLHTVLSKEMVKQVLIDTARIIHAEKPSSYERQSLLLACYAQAGQFADALSMLNKLISPPDTPDPYRNDWMVTAKGFQSRFLTAGASHVRNTLKLQNNDIHINTLDILIKLNEFFAAYRAQDPNTPQLLQDLGLLPSKNLQKKAEEIFRTQHELVRTAYGPLLLTAMKLLAAEYSHYQQQQLYMQSSSSSSSAGSTMLADLKKLGESYVFFATSIRVADGICAQLSVISSKML